MLSSKPTYLNPHPPPPPLKPSPFPIQMKPQIPTKPHHVIILPVTCCPSSLPTPPPRATKKRRRYRKPYPGEANGITEELRFIAMRLHKPASENPRNASVSGEKGTNEEEKTWVPSMEGFIRYLVESKLVFETLERIVDQSDDVSYAYFRRTGLERGPGLEKDLEWLRIQGNEIPGPGGPGIGYAEYLEELGIKSVPLFLCHFYNVYFSHVAGGQVIAKQASHKLLEGKELELYRWDGDVEVLLKGVREKLNMLSEHWTRDEKNKCLKEATKSFRYLGQIVRLIIT